MLDVVVTAPVVLLSLDMQIVVCPLIISTVEYTHL